ncbi:MAG: hypothetical protein VW642_13460 [Halieaceae bacterium]
MSEAKLEISAPIDYLDVLGEWQMMSPQRFLFGSLLVSEHRRI